MIGEQSLVLPQILTQLNIFFPEIFHILGIGHKAANRDEFEVS